MKTLSKHIAPDGAKFDNSDYAITQSRRKALEMLPKLRKRDEGGEIVRIDKNTVIIKRKRK